MPPASPRRARWHASFAVAGTLLLWWRLGGPLAAALVALAVALALLAWLAPSRYAPVQRAFDRLTAVVLAALSWLLLGALYFGVFTPLRLCFRDPLRLRPREGTYFSAVPAAARHDRQF